MKILMLLLLLLLGSDRGPVPAPLGAFPQDYLGCDGRANILFSAGSPPLLLQQECHPSLLVVLCVIWPTRLATHRRMEILREKSINT